MWKIIIENKSSVDDLFVLSAVQRVIKEGRYGKQNGHLTLFSSAKGTKRIQVVSFFNKKSDKYVVLDYAKS